MNSVNSQICNFDSVTIKIRKNELSGDYYITFTELDTIYNANLVLWLNSEQLKLLYNVIGSVESVGGQ